MKRSVEIFDAVKEGDIWKVDPLKTIKVENKNDFSPIKDQLINSESSWLRRWRMRFSSRISGLYVADLAIIGVGAYLLTFAPAQDLYQQIQTSAPDTEAIWDVTKLGLAYVTRKIPGRSIKVLDVFHDLAAAGRFKREQHSDDSGLK